MADMVDLDNLTPQQTYSILGVMPKFEVGQRVQYSPMRLRSLPRECTIEAITVEYGKIIYHNSLLKWAHEDQYKALPAKTDIEA